MHPVARPGSPGIPSAGHRQRNQSATVSGTPAPPVLSTSFLVALALLSVVQPAEAQGTPPSPEACSFKKITSTQAEAASATVVDVSAKSLATINDQWEVVTFVYLSALGDTRQTRFRISELPRKGQLLDFRDGKWCRVPSLYTTESSKYLRHALRYVPYRNQAGQDTFKFRAVDANDRQSADAVATIEIERGGLRWHITLNGSTGFPDQGPNSDDLDLRNPETIGASAQDTMFHLDWQWKAPRTVAVLDKESIHAAKQPRDARFRRRWSAHATLMAGYTQRPLAILNPADGQDPTGATIESNGDNTLMRNLSYRRAFTVGTEVNMGPVADLDAQGTFAEFGATVGAYFDAFVDGDGNALASSQRAEGTVSDYRFEGGFRLAFKQMGSDEGMGIARRHPAHGSRAAVLEPGNTEDLFVFQFLYQRQQALLDLIAAGESGDSRNRLAFRLTAMLPVPGANDNAKFVLGVEASQDIRNRGPRDVRMFYGLGLSR